MRKHIENLIDKWAKWGEEDRKDARSLCSEFCQGRAIASEQIVEDLKALLKEAIRKESEK